MSKKLLLSTSMALLLSACQGMDMGGMLSAGSSLVQAATISDSEIKALGLRSATELDRQNKVAPASNAYVKRLSKITRNLTNYQDTPLNYKIYLSDEINAFALPNGDIRVYKGLMDKMTDDELLFVIGHEVGHVMEGHSRSQARTDLLTVAARQAAAASGSSIASTLSRGQVGEFAQKLISAQYSQSQEYSSDAYGLKILKENGRPKSAAVSALNKLAELGGGSNIMSSHPDSAARAKRIDKMN